MLTRISFENFRGVAKGELGNLGALNILVGQNGAGKSTCLEALLLSRTRDSNEGMTFVARHRVDTTDLKPKSYLSGAYLFTDAAKPATIETDDVKVSYHMSGASSFSVSMKHSGGGTSSTGCGITPDAAVGTFFDDRGVCYLDVDRGYVDKLEDAVSTAEMWGYRRELVALVKCVMPTISDLRIVLHAGRPTLCVEEEQNGRYISWPAATAGDGVKRLIGVACRIAATRPLLALVEEPDAFLHATAMSQLARLLSKASQSGTQVVATTHSVDLIRLLLELPNIDREAIRIHLVSRSGVSISARCFNGNQLPTKLDDIRRELGFNG